MSSLLGDITVPGRPEVHEVSAGIYAYVQPDGTWWINNTGFLVGPPLFGAVAGATSVRGGFVLLCGTAVLLALASGRLRRRPESEA